MTLGLLHANGALNEYYVYNLCVMKIIILVVYDLEWLAWPDCIGGGDAHKRAFTKRDVSALLSSLFIFHLPSVPGISPIGATTLFFFLRIRLWPIYKDK